MSSTEVTLRDEGPWTRFMDMHTGGYTKVKPYDKILIQAPEAEARAVFYNRFDHNPDAVACTCCGSDYSVSESESLAQATAYDRNCAYVYTDPEGNERDDCPANDWRAAKEAGWSGRYTEAKGSYGLAVTPLDEYLARPDVLVIHASEISSDERTADMREHGYVWVD